MKTTKKPNVWLAISMFLLLMVSTAVGSTIYVDADASGANNGSSWADAYNCLQDALTAATSGDEIWVAQGVYKPDQGAGITPGDRTATFQLINGVAIKGGYAGFGEPDPNARDINLYETILSGDLDGNDVDVNDPADLLDEPTQSENSYHVVTGSRTNETVVLDGFTISGGNANGSGSNDDGGGMYNSGGSPTVINCTFSGNSADYFGGGMGNSWSSPRLTNCTFIGNSSRYSGGGIHNYTSNPTLTNCEFSDNSAAWGPGGGMVNASSSPILTNCTFTNNSAVIGGGMYNYIDTGPGGFEPSNPTLTNCIFSMNLASENGGGMCNSHNSYPTLTNCTFAANSAINGNALACDSYQQKFPSNVQMTNCILQDGGDEIWNNDNSFITITYSDVQGGWPGEGNIDADPCFVEPGYWDANGVWVDGDYRLLVGSPCINAGDPNYIAEPNETDLDGKPRVIGGRIDMGAYEFNHIPVADAGLDQGVYAWLDGIAEVTLDGTGSYDEDEQPLTYLWNWTIDGQIYDVNGVAPTIELPVGEQTIELIVNDRVEDSEPNQVVITVIEPVESHLWLVPRVINRHSRQPGILALLRLPEGITENQIDKDEPLLLYPAGIEAMSQRVIESPRQGTSIFAFFDKAELMDAVSTNGSVELQVVGNLKTGQYFGGTDTVLVIGNR